MHLATVFSGRQLPKRLYTQHPLENDHCLIHVMSFSLYGTRKLNTLMANLLLLSCIAVCLLKICAKKICFCLEQPGNV